MRFSIHQIVGRRHQSGQIMALFILFLVVLILIVGLGIDLGFVYITKAQLSKAVDSACLAALAHYSEGPDTATAMAQSTFQANYGVVRPGRDTITVVPIVNFGTTTGGNRTVEVDASTTINTFFVRLFPQWRTMNVADHAQAIRANVDMTIVLDCSYSMDPLCPLSNPDCSQGGAYIGGAVRTFINHFDDNLDQAAVVSFSSIATNILSMRRPFKTAVINAANGLDYSGLGTFAHGGLTNAFKINNATTVPNGQDVLKVVVFFTDGMPNVIQNSFRTSGSSPGTPCSPTGPFKAWNFGGIGNICFFPTNSFNYACCTPGCCNGGTFTSIRGSATLTSANIAYDASNRCFQVANSMRLVSNIVFAVGLDRTSGGLDPAQKSYLRQIANDPDSPTFNNQLPVGAAYLVGNGSDLAGAFDQVAADILLRLIE